MSSEFQGRMASQPWEPPPIPEHVIWRLTKNSRLAEARMRIVPGHRGGDRPEQRIYVQHPTPAFQLPWSQVTTTEDALDALARQQRQLFEAKG